MSMESRLETVNDCCESFLPSLQIAYEKAHASDTALMGVAVISLTIEPDGAVSRTRINSAKITDPVVKRAFQEVVSSWNFSSASRQVRVRYPLVFVPPGSHVDAVLDWEERTTQKSGTTGPQEGVSPIQPPEPIGRTVAGKTPPRREEKETTGTEPPVLVRKPDPVPIVPKSQTPVMVRKSSFQVQPGLYEVTTSTSLLRQPRADGEVIMHFTLGQKIRVKGAVGNYLEVYSTTGKEGGYVHREDAKIVKGT